MKSLKSLSDVLQFPLNEYKSLLIGFYIPIQPGPTNLDKIDKIIFPFRTEFLLYNIINTPVRQTKPWEGFVAVNTEIIRFSDYTNTFVHDVLVYFSSVSVLKISYSNILTDSDSVFAFRALIYKDISLSDIQVQQNNSPYVNIALGV